MRTLIDKRWAVAALGGILAGVGGCGGGDVHQEVPGAPTVDPAGVPHAKDATPPGAPTAEKHACSGHAECSGKKEQQQGKPDAGQ